LRYYNNLPRLQQLQCVEILLQQFDEKKIKKKINCYMISQAAACLLLLVIQSYYYY
jgi:hypothetical protein